MSWRNRKCLECAASFNARAYHSNFCSDPCRAAFNTRRRNRGAELYDVIMEATYGKGDDKAAAKDLLNNLTRAYKDADKHKRNERRSWQNYAIATMRIPTAYGKEGDKR